LVLIASMYRFAGVCVSVRTKSRKLLIRNWCSLVGICPVVNAGSDWKLVTFDLDLESYFRFFPSTGYTFRMALPSNFIFSMMIHYQNIYLGHGSVSKSWVQGQGHGSANAVACNSITTGRKLLGLDQKICHSNAWRNSELLTFWPWPLILRHFRIFSNSSSKFSV